jgi:hypothetical protein
MTKPTAAPAAGTDKRSFDGAVANPRRTQI